MITAENETRSAYDMRESCEQAVRRNERGGGRIGVREAERFFVREERDRMSNLAKSQRLISTHVTAISGLASIPGEPDRQNVNCYTETIYVTARRDFIRTGRRKHDISVEAGQSRTVAFSDTSGFTVTGESSVGNFPDQLMSCSIA